MTQQGQPLDQAALKAELRRLRQYLCGRAADAQAAGEPTMEIPPAEYSEFAKTISKAIAYIEIAGSSQTSQQAHIEASIQKMVQRANAEQSISVAANAT